MLNLIREYKNDPGFTSAHFLVQRRFLYAQPDRSPGCFPGFWLTLLLETYYIMPNNIEIGWVGHAIDRTGNITLQG
jgi:hypothetical protein